MKSIKKIWISLSLALSLLSIPVKADLPNILLEEEGHRSVGGQLQVIRTLIEEHAYFAALPLAQNLLEKNLLRSSGEELDTMLAHLVLNTNIRHFEQIEHDANFGTLHYIKAWQNFERRDYRRAISYAQNVPESSLLKPMALMVQGAALTLLGQLPEAKIINEKCLESADDLKREYKSESERRLWEKCRDTCVINHARNAYKGKNYHAANLHYLDLEKHSYQWPHIVFEEAWTSFYMKDYNRTLGKAVTYHSSFFESYFYPESEVLTAYAYFKMCLWGDVQRTVDDFYRLYENNVNYIRNIVETKNDPAIYLKMALAYSNGNLEGNWVLKRIVGSIVNSSAYREMQVAWKNGKEEHAHLKVILENELAAKRSLQALVRGQVNALTDQQTIMGEYVHAQMRDHLRRLEQSLVQMSYIKLESLGTRKRELYEGGGAFLGKKGRVRGDVDYVQRNEKQYFWTFNGEFWADELGDYVFALGSECK